MDLSNQSAVVTGARPAWAPSQRAHWPQEGLGLRFSILTKLRPRTRQMNSMVLVSLVMLPMRSLPESASESELWLR